MKKAYPTAEPGEWVEPNRRYFELACCDCGLVHRIEFRLRRLGRIGQIIRMRFFRNERSTAQIRRWNNIRVRGRYAK